MQYARNADAGDRITQAAETIYQALIDAELSAVIGAGPHERTETRTNHRNGSRPRTVSTTAGDLQLRIPKLRSGSFFPALLERHRRVDQCLFAVVMETYLHGTSTRKSTTWLKHWRRYRDLKKARYRGYAPIWTPKWPLSATGHCPSSGLRTCFSTPHIARLGSTSGWCPKR
jgi:transposase-like protein